MYIEVSIMGEKKLTSLYWSATKPELVISALQSQLESAQAIWPELKSYSVAKKRDHSKKPQSE